MLKDVAHLGLAVSGGADSVALFYLLLPICKKANIKVTILHLNHGLRADSIADKTFVQALAHYADIPFYAENADVSSSYSAGHSLEMTARNMRMAFFRNCVNKLKLDAIATGHQADDVAETLLLRLMRGAGATGLSGLRPLSENGYCRLIRPLLIFSSSALRAWLKQQNYTWREDISNHDSAIPRNYLRNTLLPTLEKNTPTLRARLCQSAETLREDDLLLETLAIQRLDTASSYTKAGEPTLDITRLLNEPIALQRRMLRQWLFHHAQNESAGLDTVCELLERCHNLKNWKRQLPNNTSIIGQSGHLIFRSTAMRSTPLPIVELILTHPQPTLWGNFKFTVLPDKGIHGYDNEIGTYPAVCSLNASMLANATIYIRARQPGDRITPLGQTGTQKIQDIFVNKKVPEHLRDSIPLLVYNKQVIWIPGYLIDRRFAVHSSTTPSLRITVQYAHNT